MKPREVGGEVRPKQDGGSTTLCRPPAEKTLFMHDSVRSL